MIQRDANKLKDSFTDSNTLILFPILFQTGGHFSVGSQSHPFHYRRLFRSFNLNQRQNNAINYFPCAEIQNINSQLPVPDYQLCL